MLTTITRALVAFADAMLTTPTPEWRPQLDAAALELELAELRLAQPSGWVDLR